MTYDEFKTRLTDIVGSPDTAQEKAVSFLSDVEQDYTTLACMIEKASEQERKIQELRDTNQRLFLSVTGQEAKEQEEEENNPIDWDSIMADQKE